MTAVRVSGPHGVVWVVRGQASPRRVCVVVSFLALTSVASMDSVVTSLHSECFHLSEQSDANGLVNTDGRWCSGAAVSNAISPRW